MDYSKIGTYLSRLRHARRLTAEDIALRMHVTAATVVGWESGEEIPSLEALLRLSELYGVSVNDIACADLSKIENAKRVDLPEGNRVTGGISVLGCGRWGTFLAWYLDRMGHTVKIYGRAGSANLRRLAEERRNEYVALSDRIRVTSDLAEAALAEIIVISIASQNLASLCEQLKALNIRNRKIVLCMKGIEISTGRRLSQIAEEALSPANRVAVWLGPGHVQEFRRGVPNCMVIDSNDEELKRELIDTFSSELIRFYYGSDLIGNEVGAAAKNVIGIAAGFLDGLDIGTLKGALMARGTREISRLIVAMGGNELSAYGLCHLGDYEATVFSKYSQNRSFGEGLVLGREYTKFPEGYYTVKALMRLSQAYGVELPICEAVYRYLYEDVSAADILEMLFTRTLKVEF